MYVVLYCVGGLTGIIWDDMADSTMKEEDDEWTDESKNVGYKPVSMEVTEYENECSILKCMPYGNLLPQLFVPGARAHMESVAAAVKLKYGLDFPGAAAQWTEFLLNAPQSDNVYDYLCDHPLYVPFKEELFSIANGDVRYASTIKESEVMREEIRIQLAKDRSRERRSGAITEVWRTKPCMDNKSKKPFERCQKVVGLDGKVVSVPFYRNEKDDDEEEEEEEEEDEDDEGELSSEDDTHEDERGRWCTVRRDGGVKKFGDALCYCGQRFTKKNEKNDGNSLTTGLIVAVVKNRDECTGDGKCILHFKLLRDGADAPHYVPCQDIMSTKKKNPYKVS